MIKSRLAASLLCRVNVVTCLRPFMVRECSLVDAAHLAEIQLNVLHYWVGRFLKAGLLKVTRTVKRVGRPIKFYLATAQSYVVPADMMPSSGYEAAELHEEHWRRMFWEGLAVAAPELLYVNGIRISIDEDHQLNVQNFRNPDEYSDPLRRDARAVLNTWSNALKLNPVEAKELQARLMDLFHEYQRKQGKDTYVIHIGLAPRKPDHRTGC